MLVYRSVLLSTWILLTSVIVSSQDYTVWQNLFATSKTSSIIVPLYLSPSTKAPQTFLPRHCWRCSWRCFLDNPWKGTWEKNQSEINTLIALIGIMGFCHQWILYNLETFSTIDTEHLFEYLFHLSHLIGFRQDLFQLQLYSHLFLVRSGAWQLDGSKEKRCRLMCHLNLHDCWITFIPNGIPWKITLEKSWDVQLNKENVSQASVSSDWTCESAAILSESSCIAIRSFTSSLALPRKDTIHHPVQPTPPTFSYRFNIYLI